MSNIYFDIWTVIFDFLNTKEQLNLKSCSKELYKIKLKKLTFYHNLPDNFSENKNFHDVKNLTMYEIKEKFSLVKFKSLDKLTIFINYFDKSILEPLINLKTFRIYSRNIPNLNHMINLTYLDCEYSQLNDYCIKDLNNLTHLFMWNNSHITEISHMTNLTNLDCSGSGSNISQKSIDNLHNLKILHIHGNAAIKSVNHLNNTLTYLDCGDESGINDAGISKLSNLTYLKCSRNKNINKINKNTELITLCCRDNSGIDQNSIEGLINITRLDMFDNQKIINISHLGKLIYLNAGKTILDAISMFPEHIFNDKSQNNIL